METPEQFQASPGDFLAAERTFLAWIRTGLALMALGFVLARFGLFLQEFNLTRPELRIASYGFSLWLGTAFDFAGRARLPPFFGEIPAHSYVRQRVHACRGNRTLAGVARRGNELLFGFRAPRFGA
ncbi:MAG: DUF202 domain-containing protein [Candidatus Acidiferrum sp.]